MLRSRAYIDNKSAGGGVCTTPLLKDTSREAAGCGVEIERPLKGAPRDGVRTTASSVHLRLREEVYRRAVGASYCVERAVGRAVERTRATTSCVVVCRRGYGAAVGGRLEMPPDEARPGPGERRSGVVSRARRVHAADYEAAAVVKRIDVVEIERRWVRASGEVNGTEASLHSGRRIVV